MGNKQIFELMKFLDLGEIAEGPDEVTGGLLHKMYRVATSKGLFAVKVLNREIMKRPDALRNTINSEKIASAFSDSIPVAASLEIRGRQIHELNGCYYMVFHWLEGQSVFPPDISEKECALIGDILGKMHHRNIRLEEVEPEQDTGCLYDWEEYLHAAKEKEAQTGGWLTQYEKAIKDLIMWNQAACKAQETLAKNMVISHRDLDPKNVMWKDGKPYIIDWEAAGYSNPYQEFLEVINYWADDGKGGLSQSRFDAIRKAYEKHMSLAQVSWDAVFAGGCLGMLGWLAYNVRRALGIEALDDAEIRLGEEQVKGTIRELYCYQGRIALIKDWLEDDR